MSTILKALRRLEKEKVAPVSDRPLREAVAATPHSPPPQRRRPWLPPLLALVLGIGVGASVLVLWPGGDPEIPLAAQTPQAPELPPAQKPAATVAPPPAPARARAAAAPGPPDQAFSSGVAVVERPDRAPRIAPSPPAQPVNEEPAPGSVPPAAEYTRAGAASREAARKAAEPVAAAPPRPVAATRRESIVQVPPPPAEKPVRVAAADTSDGAPAPVTRSAAAKRPAPRTEPEMQPEPVPAREPERAVVAAKPPAPKPPTSEPQQAEPQQAEPQQAEPRTSEPGIRVTRTQWHPLPERREAVVEIAGRDQPVRVHEGDMVDAYKVSEIKPSGVVLERDGQQITRELGK
jgi:hypothetical protein